MTGREPFLQAIQDEPDDPVHRLVYADWLEDDGDPARAEFVRLGAELMRRDPWDWERPLLQARSGRLLRENGAVWREEDGAAVGEGFGIEYRRGVAEVMVLRDGAAGGRLPFRPPVSALVGGQLSDARFLRDPGLSCLRELRLDLLPDGYAGALAACPHLTRLTDLAITYGAHGWDLLFASALGRRLQSLSTNMEGVPALPARPPGLRRLELHSGRMTEALSGALASPGWRGLTDLTLRNCRPLPGPDDRLLPSASLASLRSLTLWTSADLDALERLHRNGSLTALRSLEVSGGGNPPTPAVNAALAALDLPSLRHLDLSSTGLTPEAVAALARSPIAPRLESLVLRDCRRLTTPAALALAAGDFRALRRLDLSGTTIGLGGLRGLLDAPWMPGVASLNLSGLRLRTDAGAELGASGRLTGLRILNLSNNPLNAAGVTALVCSPALAGLRALDLRGTHPAGAGIDGLSRAPMAGRLEALALGGEEWIGGADPVPLAGRCPALQSLWWDRAAPATVARLRAAFGPAVAVFADPYNDAYES